MPIHITPDIATLPQNEECVRHLLVRVTAPLAESANERPAANLALVLDRSGSMDGPKMRSVITAAKSAISRLTERDRFSVVTYDDHIEVLVPSTHATPQARANACQRIDTIRAGGSTDLSTGWLTGCQQVADHLDAREVGRVLLLTDGLANRGIMDIEALRTHAAELRARGVTTSTFGVGADFNEVLLRQMADAGGGNFYFIETARQIEDYITSETGEALEITARDATLVVRVPRGVKLRSLSRHTVTPAKQAVHLDLGNLVSEQEVVLVLEARISARDPRCSLLMRMTDTDGHMADDTAQVDLERSNTPAGHPDATVVNAFITLIADNARIEALEAMQHHDIAGARARLHAAIETITPYASQVAEARSLIDALTHEMHRLEHYSALDRKKMYSQSLQRSRGRDEIGYAQRSKRNVIGVFFDSAQALHATSLAEHLCRITFGLDLMCDSLHLSDDVRDKTTEADYIVKLSRKFAHMPQRIFVTQAPLYDRWFSHWHAPCSTALVSTHHVSSTDLEAFIAYETLLHGLRLQSADYDPARLWHDGVPECLFDICRAQSTMGNKLRGLMLCGRCAQALDAMRIDVAKVEDACALVRTASAPSKR